MAMTTENVTGGDVVSDINTTPLIDVMLVLLTLLIITLPIQTHAVKLELPHGPPLPTPVVMLEVDFDGSTVWNGWRIDHATLERKLFVAAHQDPQPEIHMMANRLARYGAVAQVMAEAERNGLTKIGLIDTQR
jgi:biopolymer transport protein ExbD